MCIVTLRYASELKNFQSEIVVAPHELSICFSLLHMPFVAFSEVLSLTQEARSSVGIVTNHIPCH